MAELTLHHLQWALTKMVLQPAAFNSANPTVIGARQGVLLTLWPVLIGYTFIGGLKMAVGAGKLAFGAGVVKMVW